MRASTLVLSGILGLTGSALGQQRDVTDPYRADYIRNACFTSTQETTNREATGRAVFEGTCLASISTVMRFAPMMNEKFRFCPPPGMTPMQAIPIVLKFLDDNPRALTLDIRDVANYVGRLTWPCPKPN
jgi:hypothetical protein